MGGGKRNEDLGPGSELCSVGFTVEMGSFCKTLSTIKASSAGVGQAGFV